jgi:hypothetical protein
VFCFLTVRKLKPGAYEEFRRAWEPDWSEDWVEKFDRAYHVRSLEDENEVISFGFFNGSREDIDQMRSNEEFRKGREEQLARINEHVESVGADAIYEVLEEVRPPGR